MEGPLGFLWAKNERSTNCVGGFENGEGPSGCCRPSMNDPPTALVGFGLFAQFRDVGGIRKTTSVRLVLVG